MVSSFLPPITQLRSVYLTVPGSSEEISTTRTSQTYTPTPLYNVQPCTFVFTADPDEGTQVTITDSKGNSSFCGRAFIEIRTGKEFNNISVLVLKLSPTLKRNWASSLNKLVFNLKKILVYFSVCKWIRLES